MANVFVTGANGFIGRALTRGLVDNGHAVTGAVRSPEKVDTKAACKSVVVGEVDGNTPWRCFLEGSDVVIHLAARTLHGTAQDATAALERVNVRGTENLACEAVAAGVGRLVYVSSIKVNGERTYERPFTADDAPAPQSSYGRSKLQAELVLRRVARATGLEIVIVRPPLVYGVGVKGNFLRLMQWVDRGLPLPLASVNNRRSLIALDNLVDFLIACTQHAAAVGHTFLVSDGEDLSTPALMRNIAHIMARPLRLWSMPPPFMESAAWAIGRRAWFDSLCGSLQVDVCSARERFGWRPPVSTSKALLSTVEWYQGQRGGLQRF